MNKFKYTVELSVEIEAFDESDAWDAIQDAFGIGDMAGITIIECNYKEKRARKR